MDTDPSPDRFSKPEQEGQFRSTDESFAVAQIELKGPPYTQLFNGVEVNSSRVLETLAANTEYVTRLAAELDARNEELAPLRELGFEGIRDAIQDHHADLGFEVSYASMALICAGTNKALQEALVSRGYLDGSNGGVIGDFERSKALLMDWSEREKAKGFTPAELAGLVGATVELDTVARFKAPGSPDAIFAVGGMGGDTGIRHNGDTLKTCNVSTLASIGLAAFEGFQLHKHHSYPNTSKVGGQSAIEQLGARSDFMSQEQVERIMTDSHLIATSCHSTRTVHTVSHVIRRETINHAIGPLAFPHAAEQALLPMIGVNHNVHPETIMETLRELEKRGVQKFDGGIAFCAIEPITDDRRERLRDGKSFYDDPSLKELILLDEVAPPPFHTLATIETSQGSQTVIIEPEDFMTTDQLDRLTLDAICVPNEASEIIKANNMALDGSHDSHTAYVAMTVALGLFAEYARREPDAVREGVVNRDVLRGFFQDAYGTLKEGRAEAILAKYADCTYQ